MIYKTHDMETPVKISFFTVVLNGMPFIKYVIDCVYEFAHEIIISEGAEEKCLFAANPDGSSKDGTVEVIKNYHDPDNKIKVIKGIWKDKLQMENAALGQATGDYVWEISADELYRKEDIVKVINLLVNDPTITQVDFIPFNFWKGFDYIFYSPVFEEPDTHYRRVYKFTKDARFTSHRPPVMVYPGNNLNSAQINCVSGFETRKLDIRMYHYSYVLPEQVYQKIELYNRYGWGKMWDLDMNTWYTDFFLKWTPVNRKELEKQWPVWTGDRKSYTVKFDYDHPEVLLDFINDYRKSQTITHNLKHDGSFQAGSSLEGGDFVMNHVLDAIKEIIPYSNGPFIAIETGTIRSSDEKHESTHFISEAIGNAGVLVSIDINPGAIEISKKICSHAKNVSWILSDSIEFLKNLKGRQFNFALLDSQNNKEHIFNEFILLLRLMSGDSVIIVDDAGIAKDGKSVDEFQAEKGHLVWEFLRYCGVNFSVLTTYGGYGTQLKILLDDKTLSLLESRMSEFLKRKNLSHPSHKTKKVKIAGQDNPDDLDLTQIDEKSKFSSAIRDTFKKFRPKKVIETGTYHGTGTTKIIASAIHDFSINDSQFFTIEVNPENFKIVDYNLQKSGLRKYVTPLNGLSVPRSLLPTKKEIQKTCVEEIEFEDIYVDHQAEERAQLYFNETDYQNVPDDLLKHCMESFKYRPDFVLLDSTGYMGFIEFEYLLKHLRAKCIIALDDIYHIKHHKSYLKIKDDPRFKILSSSEEKFGYCIAEFIPLPLMAADLVKKIIWLRTDSIGDNISSASMLKYVKSKYHKAELTVVCQKHVGELYECSPYADNIITFERTRIMENEKYRNDLLDKIRSIKADVALNSVYSRDTVCDFLAIGSKAKNVVGYDGDTVNIHEKSKADNNTYYTKLIHSNAEFEQELFRHEEFLNGLGINHDNLEPVIWLSEEDENFAEKFFVENNLKINKTIALFTGTKDNIRHYDKYGSAIREICRKYKFEVVALGSENDFYINQRCLDSVGVRSINFSGKTTIRQSAAIIKRCRLVLGAETENAHIACALGTPNVIILGGGHFGRFMPYSNLTSIICLPLECYGCNWRCSYSKPYCITHIAEEVISEAVEISLSYVSDKPRVFVQGRTYWESAEGKPEWYWFNNYLDTSRCEVINIGEVPDKYEKDHISNVIELTNRLLEKGNEKDLFDKLSELVKRYPASRNLLIHITEILMQKGYLADAESILKNVLNRWPNDVNALNNLAVVEIFKKQYNEAENILQNVLRIEPDNQIARENIEIVKNTLSNVI